MSLYSSKPKPNLMLGLSFRQDQTLKGRVSVFHEFLFCFEQFQNTVFVDINSNPHTYLSQNAKYMTIRSFQ